MNSYLTHACKDSFAHIMLYLDSTGIEILNYYENKKKQETYDHNVSV